MPVEWSMTNNWEKEEKHDKMSHMSSEDWTNVDGRSSLPFVRNQVNTGSGVPAAEQSSLIPKLL
jgi:hypothetical protein